MKCQLRLCFVALPLFVACGSTPEGTNESYAQGTESAGSGGGNATGGQGGSSTGGQGGSSTGSQGGGQATTTPVSEVSKLLTGRFDSSAQSQSNPSYFDVSLVACKVQAPELGDEVLYIEQAMSSKLGSPYRQRLYVITPGADAANEAVSSVFALTNPSAFVGFCDRSEKPEIRATEASERTGCAVTLRRQDNTYVGGTVGKACASSLNGATYATSEVTLRDNSIDSWDRGYDAADKQTWGATAGAYIFDRKTPLGEQP